MSLVNIPGYESYFFDFYDLSVKRKRKGEWVKVQPIKGRNNISYRLSKHGVKKLLTVLAILTLIFSK